jgi:hypothetical protein
MLETSLKPQKAAIMAIIKKITAQVNIKNILCYIEHLDDAYNNYLSLFSAEIKYPATQNNEDDAPDFA